MVGKLHPHEVDELLSKEVVGRIGCSANGFTYVVPVTYVYEDGFIYAHSAPGMKINLMRQNPMVCFEVDRMEDMANWKSVISWGRFEELKGKEQKYGLQKLREVKGSEKTSETFLSEREMHQTDFGPFKTVVFRIKILEKSGRFEKNETN